MKYYFKIAGIKLLIESDIEIDWNNYIKEFLTEKFDKYDEYYKCILADNLDEHSGEILYEDDTLVVINDGESEIRKHFFIGQAEPCMLYVEKEGSKTIYLNKKYLESFKANDNYCIFNALAFEKVLMKHDAVVLHCSYIIHNNDAILFTAPSGTGKSTQANLWSEFKNATIVNGDRAIIKKIDGKYYACGMPICGSSDICLNEKAPIRAIIYLNQSPQNFIEEVGINEKTKKLISEITINFFNNRYVNIALDIIFDIACNVDMYFFGCTKEGDAVEFLDKMIGGGN